MFTLNSNWTDTVEMIKFFSKIFLTMAMAAIGLSTNLKDIKNMGYKPVAFNLTHNDLKEYFELFISIFFSNYSNNFFS